jgi:hypothetical protein
MADARAEQLWGALFVKDDDTVCAVTGTTVAGKSGVWMIDGRLIGRGPTVPRE